MPIRRCPYCKAIIEEGAEFCSNCGTQLLFPDDEKIEEEIPGEKIWDDEQDQKEAGDEEDSFEEERKTPSEVIEEEEKEPPEQRLAGEEDVSSGELEEEGEKEDWAKDEISGEDSVELEEREDSSGEADTGIDTHEERGDPDSKEDEGPSVDVEELESEETSEEIDSSELEKKEIDKFIASIKRDRGEDKEPMTPLDKEESGQEEGSESPPIVDDSQEFEESIAEQDVGDESAPPLTPGSELFKKQDLRVPTDSLPPWASRIKEDLTPETPLTDDMKAEPDVPLEPEDEPGIQEGSALDEVIPSDTGVWLPEGVSQKNLPFSDNLSEEKGRIRKKRPVKLLTWFKCRVFDIMILAVVWMITVWIASSVMGVGIFRLIAASALLLGMFYVILLAGYFFLFFFFLGETLGDYVFNERKGFESRRPT